MRSISPFIMTEPTTTPAVRPADPLASYPVNMDTVSDRMNLLLYGPIGVGKTYFTAGAQDHEAMHDVLFANCEGGLISVAHRTGLRAVNVNSIARFTELFWKLQRGEYPGVRTVVVDSTNEIQTLSLEEISKARRDKKGAEDAEMITVEDYGKSTVQLKRLFRMYRDLPMNVIFTAHPSFITIGQKDTPAELRTPSSIRPALTEKLCSALMGYVDFVWYYYQRENPTTRAVERVLVTREKGIVKAKTRGLKFAESLGDGVIINPVLSDLFEKFHKTQRT